MCGAGPGAALDAGPVLAAAAGRSTFRPVVCTPETRRGREGLLPTYDLASLYLGMSGLSVCYCCKSSLVHDFPQLGGISTICRHTSVTPVSRVFRPSQCTCGSRRLLLCPLRQQQWGILMSEYHPSRHTNKTASQFAVRFPVNSSGLPIWLKVGQAPLFQYFFDSVALEFYCSVHMEHTHHTDWHHRCLGHHSYRMHG